MTHLIAFIIMVVRAGEMIIHDLILRSKKIERFLVKRKAHKLLNQYKKTFVRQSSLCEKLNNLRDGDYGRIAHLNNEECMDIDVAIFSLVRTLQLEESAKKDFGRLISGAKRIQCQRDCIVCANYIRVIMGGDEW